MPQIPSPASPPWTALDRLNYLVEDPAGRPRAAYAQRHLPPLEAALAYLAREIRRLENLPPEGTRRRAKRGQ